MSYPFIFNLINFTFFIKVLSLLAQSKYPKKWPRRSQAILDHGSNFVCSSRYRSGRGLANQANVSQRSLELMV